MVVDSERVWQIAAGDADRSYYDLCLEWDVILFGPGYAGPWPECEKSLQADEWTPRKIGLVRKFCEEIEDGDLIVLRLRTSEVYGVGQVVGSYIWMDCFGDVDGWVLQHVRRVRWFWRYNETPEQKPKNFKTYTLKFGDTIQKMKAEPVMEWLASLEVNDENMARPLAKLPDCCEKDGKIQELEMQSIADHLFDEGIAADFIDVLVNRMDDLCRIASWYKRKKESPSEHETKAYLVVPLLRALGWTPQRMAVEWNRVDIALFDRIPREDANLSAIVEVKAMDRSCLTAYSQADSYAKQKGREQCSRLIVTDGIRYGVYLRQGEDSKLEAYLNLTRMLDTYPILKCKGAKDALTLMSADWRNERGKSIGA